jgi:hypothetical protein
MGKLKKGQVRRASVMDQFNLPDLTEFIDTLATLVRGCMTGALKEKGTPPTALPGPLIAMPQRERKEIFDRKFFSSMLEMDYNTQAAVLIILHISWEDIAKTKWCLEIILSELAKNGGNEKSHIFLKLLQPVLQMQDSLQNTRVIIALSPFVNSNAPRGLLALIHELHNNNSKFSYQLIKYLMQLSNNIAAVASYLGKQKKEMMWIEQFLEAKVGARDLEVGNGNGHVNSDNDENGDEGMDSDNEVIVYGPQQAKQKKQNVDWRKGSANLTCTLFVENYMSLILCRYVCEEFYSGKCRQR